MNILFVTYHTCARAAKEARALERAGHQVIILQNVAASEEILYATELSSFYRTEADLQARISYFAEWAEVIHVHNEPNWIVSAAAAARDRSCPLVPVIFDVHDLDSQRAEGNIDKDETPAIHASDGFIFPSKSYQIGVQKIYNIGILPARVIYSMCSRDDIVTDKLPRVNGLVYEGATVAPMANFNDRTPGYKAYRDYVGLSKQLTALGIPFHIYGVRKDFQRSYLNAGAVVHDLHPFPDMMRQISRYDWGLCGHLGDHPQWQKAMPNKLFEYIAAGIPVVAINAGEVGEFVERYGLGIKARHIAELIRVVTSKSRDHIFYNIIRETVEENRHKFVMESQVPEVEALYGEAAAFRKCRLEAGLQMRAGAAGKGANRPWVCFNGAQVSTTDRGGCDQSECSIQSAAGEDQGALQRELPA